MGRYATSITKSRLHNFCSYLIVWFVVFLGVTATTYGRLNAKVLGLLLAVTATYTFWLPAIILALGNEIP